MICIFSRTQVPQTGISTYLGYTQSCETNSIAMFCCTSSITSDPPLCAASHVPVPGDHPGAIQAGLRKRRLPTYLIRRLQSVLNGAICQTFNSGWPGVHGCWTPCQHSAVGDNDRRRRRSLPMGIMHAKKSLHDVWTEHWRDNIGPMFWRTLSLLC